MERALVEHPPWGIPAKSLGGTRKDEWNTTGNVTDVDDLVRSASALPTESVDQLTDALCALVGSTAPSAVSEIRSMRAIFSWICFNIDYDVEGLYSGEPVDCTPDGVLKSGKGVCSGYSSLFCAMSKRAGLTVEAVMGHSKGAGYVVGDSFSNVDTDHEWNKVLLGGEWYLLDSTWGAGHVSNGQFVRQFNPHYWLTPPDVFFYDHLPAAGSESAQLLDPPQSLRLFTNLVQLKSNFFVTDMRLVSTTQARIEVGSCSEEVRLELNAPLNTKVIASLESKAGTREKFERRTYIQRDSESIIVLVRPPASGSFELKIFSITRDPSEKPQTDGQEQFDWSCSYLFDVLKGTNLAENVPRHD